MDNSKDSQMGQSIRVLIADDIYRVRHELVTALQLAAKFSQARISVVGEAQNGAEAIEQATLLHPHLILMDLEMPGTEGYIATRSIKSTHPCIKIIILTIHGSADNRQAAFDAGADAFIEKGGPINELLQTILMYGRSV